MHTNQLKSSVRREKTIQNFGAAIVKKARQDRWLISTLQDGHNAEDADIIKVIFDHFEEADPTANKEYLLWIAVQYAKGNIRRAEDLSARIQPALKKYHKLKQSTNFSLRDITQLQAGQLETLVAQFNDRDWVKEAKRGLSKEVYNDENVRIIVPQDHIAAHYYGRGTRWCTASAKSDFWFYGYNSYGPLYILIPLTPRHTDEKYQLHFPHGQFMDEQDKPQSLLWLIEKRFEGLSEIFIKHEPDIEDYIAFASDEALQPVIDKIGELVRDKIKLILGEWETDDAAATLFQKDALEVLQVTPEQCRNFATGVTAYQTGETKISDMDKVIAEIVFNELLGKDKGLSSWIKNRVLIEYDLFTKQWAVRLVSEKTFLF